MHEAIKDRQPGPLAHQLTDQDGYLFFETLNLKGMQRLWGRKVNDRDENAANNIKEVGSLSLGLGDVRPSQTAVAA